MALPIPQIDDENRAFWTGGADGELRFERCNACGYYLHPPSPRCPFVLAVVELSEQPGLRLIARVVDCEAPTIGMAVDVAFEARGDAFIPFFRPAS